MSLRSSRIVKTKASDTPFIMYMSAQPLPFEAFGMGIDVTKVTFLSHILSFFYRQNVFLWSDLTLLNTNIQKKFTFA